VTQQDEMLAVLRAAYDVATDVAPSALANPDVVQHYVSRRRLRALLTTLAAMTTLTEEARASVSVRLEAFDSAERGRERAS
jgi:hypothetical protein